MYPDPALRERVEKRFPGSIGWPPVGLPDDYLALIAPGRSSFVLPSAAARGARRDHAGRGGRPPGTDRQEVSVDMDAQSSSDSIARST